MGRLQNISAVAHLPTLAKTALTLENKIGKRVVGQDVSLNVIAQQLRAAKTGLTSENGPQGGIPAPDRLDISRLSRAASAAQEQVGISIIITTLAAHAYNGEVKIADALYSILSRT